LTPKLRNLRLYTELARLNRQAERAFQRREFAIDFPIRGADGLARQTCGRPMW
jgi:hypothetical protein